MPIKVADEPLRRLWVKRLYAEFDALNYQYSLKLTPPIIAVEDLAGRWGYWDPLTRTITLAVRLIATYRWDVVLEILKHEMAHMLVSSTPARAGEQQERPHGAAFAAACERLRVAGWARSASGALPTELPASADTVRTRTLSEQDERLLRRAEKLLSLAGSSNEHEALLAMQRVQELYARHDLERLQQRRDPAVVTLTLHLGRRRLSRVDSMLLMILSEHFFVRVIRGLLFDAADGRDYCTADLIGTRANVLMAEHVHAFLGRQIEALWRSQRRRLGGHPSARRDYQLGVLSGFHAKLRRSRDSVVRSSAGAPAPAASASAATAGALAPAMGPAEVRALVAWRERELDDFVAYRYPKLRTTRWSAGYHDAASFEAGQRDGQKIVISPTVTGEPSRPPRLLPR